MTALLYYSSASGNTARFISKLELPAMRLPESGKESLPIINRPFVLVCPTFADGAGRGAVPKPVIRALNDARIREYLRGVIAGGNRNFGVNFALAGKIISRKCHVPVLYQFELAGTANDIYRVKQGLEHLWNPTRLNEATM